MNPAINRTSPRRAWADWILIGIFLSLLWLPTLDSWLSLDWAPATGENRLPAPRPKLTEFSFRNLQHYQAGWEAYFNDHYGFRKRLIRLFQHWKLNFFHDNSVYQVIIGQKGWLFWAQNAMIEHYLGLARFTPVELQTWQTVLERRRDWLAARGIKYLFVIPPDKQDIYPEFLPPWLIEATPANRETKLDQFLNYMRANSTVEILDLRQTLIDAKKIAPTYLQNDTHWNSFGGFVAAQAVIQTLSQQFPDLPPLRLADFNWTNAPATGGDLTRMLGSQVPEKNDFVFTPKSTVVAPVNRPATNIISLWDPHKPSVISENPRPLTETAVVFHDSYGFPWQQFLGYSFKRIVFMYENREFNTQVIAENHPQVVINEILERYFDTQDPQELLAHDRLP